MLSSSPFVDSHLSRGVRSLLYTGYESMSQRLACPLSPEWFASSVFHLKNRLPRTIWGRGAGERGPERALARHARLPLSKRLEPRRRGFSSTCRSRPPPGRYRVRPPPLRGGGEGSPQASGRYSRPPRIVPRIVTQPPRIVTNPRVSLLNPPGHKLAFKKLRGPRYFVDGRC